MEPLLADADRAPHPPAGELSEAIRRAPEPLHGGPLALLRFMRANDMLNLSYARLIARYVLLKARVARVQHVVGAHEAQQRKRAAVQRLGRPADRLAMLPLGDRGGVVGVGEQRLHRPSNRIALR